MRKFFRRRIGIQKMPVRVLLVVAITTIFYVKFAYSQNDGSMVSEEETVARPLEDTQMVSGGESTDLSQNAGTLTEKDEGVAETGEAGNVVTNGHEVDQITRGERFFLGLLPFDRNYQACVSCHNIKELDTLNWNPSAYDIAVKYANMDFASFQEAVMNPTGVKMQASHKNFNIKEEDLKSVKLYLDDMAAQGRVAEKPSIDNLILFLFLGLLITWAIIELIFLKKVRLRYIPVIILLVAFGLQVNLIVTDAIRLGRQQNYAPDQPIKFSHKVHVAENGIDCRYCHTTVEQGKSAGIPTANLCMNCHILIREGTNSGKFEIAKVVNAAETGKPIEWNRIHNLPDYVFFSHEVHVGSAKIDCATCHGPVEEMDIMRQYSDLSMGWCVNCHRETQVANFKDNSYYDQYTKLHEDLKEGKIDKVTAEDLGANDCMRCHY